MAFAVAVICPAASACVQATGEGALELVALEAPISPAPGGKSGGGPSGVCCPKLPGLLPLLLGPLESCGVGAPEYDVLCDEKWWWGSAGMA